MAVRNDIDRCHLVMDAIDRVPKLGYHAVHIKQLLRAKLIEHQRYIEQLGQDMPKVLQWQWLY